MRAIVVAAALIALAGCGLFIPTPSAPIATAAPDYVRHLDAGYGIVRRLLVYDPRGLLTEVQIPNHIRGGDPNNAWWGPVAGDHNSLIFIWLGGNCAIDPTLRISTHGETNQGIELSLDIFDGHAPPLPSGEACAGVGIWYNVVLTFRRPIADFHISTAESF